MRAHAKARLTEVKVLIGKEARDRAWDQLQGIPVVPQTVVSDAFF